MPHAVEVELVAVACWKCGIAFAVPESFRRQRLRDGRRWRCPNGHANLYEAESNEDRHELIAALHRAEQAEAAAEEARASAFLKARHRREGGDRA